MPSTRQPTLTIALTKGRILKETLPLLERAGIGPVGDVGNSRKLVFDSRRKGVRLLLLRGADVPTYVRHGAADMGVVGKDMLLEHGATGLYEPLDLQIARCRLMTAAPVGWQAAAARLRVASKFPRIARRFFAQQAVHTDVIELYGALELAPLMGLADVIVDIVASGNTLRTNGLAPLQLIAGVSARLVVNKAAMRSRHAAIQDIVAALSAAVGAAA